MLLVNLVAVYCCRKLQQSAFANLTRWYFSVHFFEPMESRVTVDPALDCEQCRHFGKEAVFFLLTIAVPAGMDRSRVGPFSASPTILPISSTSYSRWLNWLRCPLRCEVVVLVLTFLCIAPYHIPFCFPQHSIYSLHHPRWNEWENNNSFITNCCMRLPLVFPKRLTSWLDWGWNPSIFCSSTAPNQTTGEIWVVLNVSIHIQE